MSTTTNLGLTLTGEGQADVQKLFLTWRNEMSGETGTSNMEKIDAAYGEMAETIENLTTATEDIKDRLHDITMALSNGVHIYGAKWDGTNAKMSRMFDATDITTDITNFAHRGATNTDYNNPFDAIYPFSEFKACNVSVDTYVALEDGADIRGAVTAWYGDPDFKYDGTNGLVGAYRPEYWFTAYKDGTDTIFAIADGKIDGWVHSPAYIRGMGFAVDAGDNKLTCNSGQPLTNVQIGQLHTRAKNTGFTIDDIYTYSAEVTAMIVEFADMNTQRAIGNGVDSNYRSNNNDKPFIAETGATRVVLPKDFAPFAVVGATLDFGASKDAVVAANRRTCTGYEVYSEDSKYISVNFDTALDVTTDMFVSAHGMVNGEGVGNASGYIGANGKANAFYRGAIAHANRWRYILGAYRQAGTAEIWVCNDPDKCDDYDALNTASADHIDTGYHLPIVDGEKKEGYIQTLAVIDGLGAVPVCTSVGGNSTNPVGDYCYQPALTTGNTVLVAGGTASSGAICGAFSGSWSYSSSSSTWHRAVSPVLK